MHDKYFWFKYSLFAGPCNTIITIEESNKGHNTEPKALTWLSWDEMTKNDFDKYKNGGNEWIKIWIKKQADNLHFMFDKQMIQAKAIYTQAPYLPWSK